MKKLDLKIYQIILFVALLIIGIIFLALFSDSTRFVGVILITIDLFYAGTILYSGLNSQNNGRLRSRTREQIFKYSHRK